MSPQLFVLTVVLCAAAIALWFDRRLHARIPRTPTWTVIHLVGSLLALRLLPQLVTLVVGGGPAPERIVAATVFVLLPVLTYLWLSALWLFRLIQRSADFRM